jgi:glycosyltransferase involved in cell wall biosynthesis
MGKNPRELYRGAQLIEHAELFNLHGPRRRTVAHKPMRILYVHERFGALGGAEANAMITARELKARGQTVGLLHGPATGKGEPAWCDAFEFRYPLSQAKKGGEKTKAALVDFDPDVIYVHKMADLSVIEALVASGKPLVRMVHDHDIYCMRSYKYSYFTRKICDRAASPYCVFPCLAFLTRNHGDGLPIKYVSYLEKVKEIELNKKFDRMISVSQFMRNELLMNGFDESRVEIFPPIPPPGDPNLRSTFSDRNLIVYAGQIIRGKGVDVLLEALTLLKVPFECIILGEGTHKAECEKLAQKLGLTRRVSFKGFVPQEELKHYYEECSVVALSSVWPEPIATIGLEVMRYALPVVGFDAGGVKDWLIDGYNGFLVPWMNKKAFAEKLEVLLNDKALARRMGENGLKVVTGKFDFSNYIRALENLFQTVIKQKQTTETVAAEMACVEN